MNKPHQTLPGRQRGLTLIELVAVIIILAVALIGVSAAISGAVSRSSDVLLETRAVALAQSYLDEILAKRFDERTAPRGIPPCRSNCTDEVDFGLDGGESGREDFDDVDDYHDLDEGLDQATPLQDAEGMDRLGYDNFRVRVTVRYLQLGVGQPEEELASEPNDLTDVQDAKLITVTVNHASMFSEWSFSVYKANY
ncbi:type II secretion system protein [Pseudohongiella acticola]|uniref:type IV pilus modification PilV family protein n=1 Tax=Pseudohongiella acticola TaxID=1524254 RepID=UPI0030EDA812